MLHQFFVNEEDRDLLRFFWWENGDLDTAPVEYRMQVPCLGPFLHLAVPILDSSKLQMMGKKNSELRLRTSYGETSMSMMA